MHSPADSAQLHPRRPPPSSVTSLFIAAGPDDNLWFTLLGDATGQITTGSATLPPTITKSFGAASIPLNGTTTLNFTIDNPNVGGNLTGVGFTDTFPAGLVVSTPNGLTGSCGSGTIVATAGSGAVTLAVASLAATASCAFSVNVTGSAVGTQKVDGHSLQVGVLPVLSSAAARPQSWPCCPRPFASPGDGKGRS